MGGVKDKIASLFKASITNNYSNACQQCAKKTKNKSEDNVIQAIKNRIITDIKNLFEQEEDYYKPARVDNLYSNNHI